MHTDFSALAGITELDAAVQRLLAIRSQDRQGGSHPLLKQAFAEIDQVIEELQVMFEVLSQGCDDTARLAAAVTFEQRRRVELMESLSVACVLTDAQGTILEANTSALLLLGASVANLGRATICDYAADRTACEALITRAASGAAVVDTLLVRRNPGAAMAVTVSVATLRNLEPARCRWFLQRA
jgi:PAS domain-containing protein